MSDGFNWDFSLGNLINIVAMGGAGLIAWGSMTARSDVTHASLESLQAANVTMEQRIRTLETGQVRNDEKLNSILEAVRRIEKTVETPKRP
jgi:cell division protein FtsB